MLAIKAFLKWTTIFINILIMLISALVIVAVALDHASKADDGNGKQIAGKKALDYVMAVSIILVAIVGIFGAYLNDKHLLVHYMRILIVPLFCQILFVLYYKENKQLHATEKFVNRVWKAKDDQPGPMNHLQEKYMCCGKHGASDYTDSDIKVPQSCFNSTTTNLSDMHPFDEGCMSAVQRAHLNFYQYEYWTYSVPASFEIVALLLALVMYARIKMGINNNDYEDSDNMGAVSFRLIEEGKT